jgi:hypothetical protein
MGSEGRRLAVQAKSGKEQRVLRSGESNRIGDAGHPNDLMLR